jgi:hypothetical protein
MIQSKFLTEIVIVDGVNNKFALTNSGASTSNIEIEDGVYRDIIDFSDAFASACAAVFAGQTWSMSIYNNGIVSIDSNNSFDIDFDTSNFGVELRDLLGFTANSASSTSNAIVSNTYHEGGYYPNEPIEDDSRPDEYGEDIFDFDIFTSEARDGTIASKGGSNEVKSRDITILLTNDELQEYIDWLRYSKNRPFCFYHNREEDWPGPNSEYNRYRISFNDANAGYNPEFLEANRVWFRVNLSLRQVE